MPRGMPRGTSRGYRDASWLEFPYQAPISDQAPGNWGPELRKWRSLGRGGRGIRTQLFALVTGPTPALTCAFRGTLGIYGYLRGAEFP